MGKREPAESDIIHKGNHMTTGRRMLAKTIVARAKIFDNNSGGDYVGDDHGSDVDCTANSVVR